MALITIDFETYYDSKIKLGFKHQTTEEYIRDKRFEVIGVGVKVDEQPTVWVSGGMPFVHVSMYSLDSFKQSQLVSVLEYLSDKTAELDGSVNCEDYAASINRDFRFTTTKWTASISAYVKDDSPTCRKVVIGTEMVEKTKYQIVCD
jgi:hypothetical protein